MTIREELKKLVTKLGGTTSKDDQTAELIHKVTDNVSGGGGSSVITVTVSMDHPSTDPSISADEVIEGLQNGLRYELIATSEYHDSIMFGELRLMQSVNSDNVKVFAIVPTSGAMGGNTRLSVALAGITSEWSDAANDYVNTWFVNRIAYYIDLGQYD